jgi:hypothetical protein
VLGTLPSPLICEELQAYLCGYEIKNTIGRQYIRRSRRQSRSAFEWTRFSSVDRVVHELAAMNRRGLHRFVLITDDSVGS